MSKLSVCILAYNEEFTIEECINSVQQQVDVEIEEILVGVNSSIDKTEEIVLKMAITDKRIKIINSEKGKAIAWNSLNKEAKNILRVFIDGDCKIDKTAVKSMINLMKKFDISIVGGTINYINKGNNIMSKILNFPSRLYSPDYHLAGGMYLVDYNKILMKMNKYGFDEMPIDLIADDRWLALISEDSQICRTAHVYTRACSITDEINRNIRFKVADKQIREQYSNIIENRKEDVKKCDLGKLRKEQIRDMGIIYRIIYILILPFKKILKQYIKIKCRKLSDDEEFKWEKSMSSRIIE